MKKTLTLSECDSFPLTQQWSYFQALPSSYFYLCGASGGNCVAVISFWMSSRKPEVTIQEADLISWQKKSQYWVLDYKTSQLRNIATGLCLGVFPSSVKNPVSSLESKWKFEMNPCLDKPKKAQKWSMIPVRDNNNATLCLKGGLEK